MLSILTLPTSPVTKPSFSPIHSAPSTQLRQGMSEHQANQIQNVITWTAPALVIPALRYLNDDKQDRERLFVRDFSTYLLGSGLYLGVQALSYHTLHRVAPHWSLPQVQLASFGLALTANLLYAGVGAVYVSKWVEALHQHCLQKEYFPHDDSSSTINHLVANR